MGEFRSLGAFLELGRLPLCTLFRGSPNAGTCHHLASVLGAPYHVYKLLTDPC